MSLASPNARQGREETKMNASQRTQVSVVRETARALLVEAAGQQGWIQRRWLRADGTVSADTFQKAVASNQARKAELAAERQAEASFREFKNSSHLVTIARQTEKAIACEVELELAGCHTTKIVWFAKSCCEPGEAEGTALVPGWLIVEKHREVTEGFCGGSYYERHRFCKGERATLVRGVC